MGPVTCLINLCRTICLFRTPRKSSIGDSGQSKKRTRRRLMKCNFFDSLKFNIIYF